MPWAGLVSTPPSPQAASRATALAADMHLMIFIISYFLQILKIKL
jgi:hypothetical protein